MVAALWLPQAWKSQVETVDGVHSVMVHKARGVGVIDRSQAVVDL